MPTMRATVTTLVCDDEPDAREGLIELLKTDPDVSLVGEARNGVEAATAIRLLSPDLVFLDVQMPKLDGLAMLEQLREATSTPVVVFVTAYDEYALKAFELHALDYLLKPFSDARFREALATAKMRVRERRACALGLQIASLLQASPEARDAVQPESGRATQSATERRYLEHVMVRVGGRVNLVRVEDIDWIEADDYCARLHVKGRAYLLRQTMRQLEQQLDPHQFVRVHRSSIVRIDCLRTLEPYVKGSHVLTLHDGTRLTLSRARRGALEAALGSRVG
jgi:two-component system LytT family response regulator